MIKLLASHTEKLDLSLLQRIKGIINERDNETFKGSRSKFRLINHMWLMALVYG